MRFFDEYDEKPEAFYAEAVPCESCGVPCFEARIWNAEHEMYLGVECGCAAPEAFIPKEEEPMCLDLYALRMACQTVGEMMDASKQHKATCEACGGTPIESPVCMFLEILIVQTIDAGKMVDIYRKHQTTCRKCRRPDVVELKEAA